MKRNRQKSPKIRDSDFSIKFQGTGCKIETVIDDPKVASLIESVLRLRTGSTCSWNPKVKISLDTRNFIQNGGKPNQLKILCGEGPSTLDVRLTISDLLNLCEEEIRIPWGLSGAIGDLLHFTAIPGVLGCSLGPRKESIRVTGTPKGVAEVRELIDVHVFYFKSRGG